MLDSVFLQNTLRLWLVALLTALAVYLVLRLILGISRRQLKRLARRTETWIDDLVAQIPVGTRQWILVLLALFIGSKLLTLPEAVDQWANALAMIAVLYQVGVWGTGMIQSWTARMRGEGAEAGADLTTMQAAAFIGRLLLYTILLLLALDNIPGVEITTLIASLGIGGVAVALAVQNILGDLFASLSIAFDKPFAIGDTIQVGEFVGTVEHVGLKTTRLRNVAGEQLIFSNNDLLQSRIRNFQRMEERRLFFTLGVVFDTPLETLERIPAMIQEVAAGREGLRLDRAHFRGPGPSSLDFEVVCYVLAPEYLRFMDEQQALHLAILRKFQAEGIALAYPTQTIYLAPRGSAAEAGEPASDG